MKPRHEMNDIEREIYDFVQSTTTLTGCDEQTARDAHDELAEATVGSPCPLYRMRRRFLDRLESDMPADVCKGSARVRNAIEYALSKDGPETLSRRRRQPIHV